LHCDLPIAELIGVCDPPVDDGLTSCPASWKWPAVRSEIRRVYRSLARKMHPDAGGTDASFRTLHQAYLDAMAVAAR
jgi:hypothetical protein